MKHFEDSIKPGFRSKDDRVQYVTFPGADLEDNPSKGLKRDAIAVTGYPYVKRSLTAQSNNWH